MAGPQWQQKDRQQVGHTELGTPYRIELDIYLMLWNGKEKERRGRERKRKRDGEREATSLREGAKRERKEAKAANWKGVGMACLLKRQSITIPALIKVDTYF